LLQILNGGKQMPLGAPKPAMFHMLKSLGIDPEQLQSGIEGISKFTADLDKRLQTLESKLDRILEMLEDAHAAQVRALPDNVHILTPDEAGITVTPITGANEQCPK
jgi:hypothetical protein